MSGLNEKIDALNIVFSESNGQDSFYLSSVASAGAANSFGVKKDEYGKELEVSYSQACIGFSIDRFIEQYDLQVPNYIKIDLDGIDPLILGGGGRP